MQIYPNKDIQKHKITLELSKQNDNCQNMGYTFNLKIL